MCDNDGFLKDPNSDKNSKLDCSKKYELFKTLGDKKSSKIGLEHKKETNNHTRMNKKSFKLETSD